MSRSDGNPPDKSGVGFVGFNGAVDFAHPGTLAGAFEAGEAAGSNRLGAGECDGPVHEHAAGHTPKPGYLSKVVTLARDSVKIGQESPGRLVADLHLNVLGLTGALAAFDVHEFMLDRAPLLRLIQAIIHPNAHPVSPGCRAILHPYPKNLNQRRAPCT